jgi:hypothetical protein
MLFGTRKDSARSVSAHPTEQSRLHGEGKREMVYRFTDERCLPFYQLGVIPGF